MLATFCVIRLGSSKMYRVLAFALIAAASCNDLIQGPETGRKIYNETKEASPAIWKQKDEVTIRVNDTDVISRIVITDLRPDKDGEVKIVAGGQGQKNVTVELKSPTIFRGYDFRIEVYAVNENGQEIIPEEWLTTEVSHPEEVTSTEQIPVMENDTKVNPKESVTGDKTSAVAGQDKIEAPVITDRKSRNTDVKVDSIVQYVSENITENNKPRNLLLPGHLSLPKGPETANMTPIQDNVAPRHSHLFEDEEFNRGQ